MTQPGLVITSSTSTTITSGPMSEGMIGVNTRERTRRQNADSTERICMFALCLMFIGVPIIVVGIIFLSFIPLLGIILMVSGVIASSSGTILAILSAILTVFIKKPPMATAPVNSTDEQTPDIVIESDDYIEHFADNLCEELPQQLSASNLPNSNDPDFMAKLDPVYWSNYPEAQNPKSYLNSFGDLPKVMPSPEPSSTHDKTTGHKSNKKVKYEEQIKRKLSKTMKIGRNRRTISRTELTRDYSDEIESTSSSSSPSSPKSGYFKINANESGVKQKNSIITIENTVHNVSFDDNIDDNMADNIADSIAENIIAMAARSSIDCTTNDNTDNELNVGTGDEERRQTVDLKTAKSDDKYVVNKIDKTLNGIQNTGFTDECENIELTERHDSDVDSGLTLGAQGEGFDNLWKNIREQNK